MVDKTQPRHALAEPEFEKALTDSGFETRFLFRRRLARKCISDRLARWKPVIDAIGLKTL